MGGAQSGRGVIIMQHHKNEQIRIICGEMHSQILSDKKKIQFGFKE